MLAYGRELMGHVIGGVVSFYVSKAILCRQINGKIKGVASRSPSTCMPAACQNKGVSGGMCRARAAFSSAGLGAAQDGGGGRAKRVDKDGPRVSAGDGMHRVKGQREVRAR